MEQWEYLQARIYPGGSVSISSEMYSTNARLTLNALGIDGWECVSVWVDPKDGDTKALFKRRIDED